MPINFAFENSSSVVCLGYRHSGKLGSILTALQYEHDKFIRYIENVRELQKLLLLTKNRILNDTADIQTQINDLEDQHKILIDTLEQLSISLKIFINNPILETAVNLKESYKRHSKNLDKLNAYDYNSDSEFKTNIDLLKSYIDLSAMPNYMLKFFQKDLDELIRRYKNLGNFKTIDFEQWYFNIILLANKSFRRKLNGTDYFNNLVEYLCQSNNPIIGDGLCAGMALYGVYQSLTTGDIQVESDLLVSNEKISYLEQCQFFAKINTIPLIPITKLTGKAPKQASKLIAEKLKFILQDIEQHGFELFMKANNHKTPGHAFGISKTKDHLFFIDANYGVFKFNVNELEKFCNFISWFLYTTKYCHYFNAFGVNSMPSIEHEFKTPWKLQLNAIHNLLTSTPAKSNNNDSKFKNALRFTKNCITNITNSTRDLVNSSHVAATTLFDCCRIR